MMKVQEGIAIGGLAGAKAIDQFQSSGELDSRLSGLISALEVEIVRAQAIAEKLFGPEPTPVNQGSGRQAPEKPPYPPSILGKLQMAQGLSEELHYISTRIMESL